MTSKSVSTVLVAELDIIVLSVFLKWFSDIKLEITASSAFQFCVDFAKSVLEVPEELTGITEGTKRHGQFQA